MSDHPKVIFVVTEDWYFCSHRLPIARAARDAGCEVIVATRVKRHGEAIKKEGFRLVPISLRRRSKHPWKEAKALWELICLYRREQPDLVHHVALKPSLYGSLAAKLTGSPPIVNALMGLGYVYSSTDLKARLFRPLLTFLLSVLLTANPNRSRIIVQNPDDRRTIIKLGIGKPDTTVLIRGSGVDLKQFCPSQEPEQKDPIVVTLVSRMLWDKGIGELVEASRLLRDRGRKIKIILVGSPDSGNPGSIRKEQLREWQRERLAEWRAHQEDISAVWEQSHIAVLPSYYGEGLPKSLLEAAACARPIIASDMPGCTEIVKHEVNGLLVPPRSPERLADAIVRLADDAQLRRKMGLAGRAIVESEFSDQDVVRQTMTVYSGLMGYEWLSVCNEY